MFNVLTENLLNFYFFSKAAAGEHADGRAVLKGLCSAYLMDDKYGEFSDLCSDPLLVGIDSFDSYNRWRRIQTYNALTGAGEAVGETVGQLVNIKGKALKTAKDYGLDNPRWLTPSSVYDVLSRGAEAGITQVITLLGFLQYEGILVEQDKKAGLKKLMRSADWNDPSAIILCISYDADGRTHYIDKLATVWNGAQYEGAIKTFTEKYGIVPHTDENALVLNRAFKRGVLKNVLCDFKYGRVINSNVLDFGEKQEMVLGGRKELVYEIANLPLNIGTEQNLFSDGLTKIISGIPLQSAEVNSAVVAGVKSAGLRRRDDYRPMCVCGGEKYVNDAYKEAIKSALSDGCNVVDINVADVSLSGWEPTRDNAIIRSLAEKKNNVVFLSFYGLITEQAFEGAEKFLRTSLRRETRLNLGVSLDLSDVLVIAFADGANAMRLEKICQTVELAPVGGKSREEAVKRMIREEKNGYGVKLAFDGESITALSALSLDECSDIIKKALVQAYSGGKCKFNLEETLKFIKSCAGKNSAIGFNANS